MRPQLIPALILAGASAEEIRAALRPECFAAAAFADVCEHVADGMTPSVHRTRAHAALTLAVESFREMAKGGAS